MKEKVKKIVLVAVAGIFACAGLFGATVNNKKETTAKTERTAKTEKTARTDDKATDKESASNTLIKKIEIINNSRHKVELTFIEVDPDDNETDDQSITVDAAKDDKTSQKETKNVEVFGKGKFITDIQYSLEGEKDKRTAVISEGTSATAPADQSLIFNVKRDAANKVLHLTINDSASTGSKANVRADRKTEKDVNARDNKNRSGRNVREDRNVNESVTR